MNSVGEWDVLASPFSLHTDKVCFIASTVYTILFCKIKVYSFFVKFLIIILEWRDLQMKWMQDEIIRLISECTDFRRLRIIYAYIHAVLK